MQPNLVITQDSLLSLAFQSREEHSNFEQYLAIMAAHILSALFYFASLPGTPIVYMSSLDILSHRFLKPC